MCACVLACVRSSFPLHPLTPCVVVSMDGNPHLQVLSELPFFTLNERYLYGEETTIKRRDFRKGRMTGWLCHDERNGNLRVFLEWPEPYAGGEESEYVMVGEHELRVLTRITVRGETLRYRQIFRRKGAPKHKA